VKPVTDEDIKRTLTEFYAAVDDRDARGCSPSPSSSRARTEPGSTSSRPSTSAPRESSSRTWPPRTGSTTRRSIRRAGADGGDHRRGTRTDDRDGNRARRAAGRRARGRARHVPRPAPRALAADRSYRLGRLGGSRTRPRPARSGPWSPRDWLGVGRPERSEPRCSGRWPRRGSASDPYTDPERWLPLSLGTFFSEGWDEPWISPPRGGGSAEAEADRADNAGISPSPLPAIRPARLPARRPFVTSASTRRAMRRPARPRCGCRTDRCGSARRGATWRRRRSWRPWRDAASAAPADSPRRPPPRRPARPARPRSAERCRAGDHPGPSRQ
jgi:hypothetical protein